MKQCELQISPCHASAGSSLRINSRHATEHAEATTDRYRSPKGGTEKNLLYDCRFASYEVVGPGGRAVARGPDC